ncbi:MAG: AAA family ATPase [Gaiellaceae bacterium]
MAAAVVCISRTMGAGGEEVGRLVAGKLGFDYVDEDIVSRAAERGEVTAEDVADAERRQSLLRRLLTELGTGGGAETYGLAPVPGGNLPDDMRAFIREAIEEAAGRGSVVIVAHAASYALASREGILRVLVTASPETRAGRHEGSIKSSDAERADYLRRFYGVEHELPTHYDLVINTDVVSVEQAAELIALAAR